MSDVSAVAVDERLTRILAALRGGIPKLLAAQSSNGSWRGWNLAGPQFSAQWLIVMRHFEILEPDDEEEISDWILRQQRPDGGFPASPAANISDLPTSVLVRCATDPVLPSERRERLDTFIAWNRGFAAADPMTLVFASLAGMFEPRALGRWSLVNRLIPGIDRFLGRRISAVSSLMVNLIPIVVQYLQNGSPLGPGFHPIKRIEWMNAIKYLEGHQNTGGSFAGILFTTALGAVALEGLGCNRNAPHLAAALEALGRFKVSDDTSGETKQIVPYTSEVWNTASVLRTLLKLRPICNSTLRDLEFEQQLEKGLRYLIAEQSSGVPADWLNPAPGAPLGGGWAYEAQNAHGSDCDTTALVLTTLEIARKELDWTEKQPLLKDLEAALERGQAWLWAMQNASGGWPAFTHGLRPKPPGPLFTKPLVYPRPTLWSAIKLVLDPPLELGDPAWAGLTGRVIAAEAELGIAHSDTRIAKAIRFMHGQLGQQPGWWGRWAVNYLAGSAFCLSGIARSHYYRAAESSAAAESLRWVTDVGDWIERCQNGDGGWGETPISYLEPGLAGVGDSASGITAVVLAGFLDMGWFERGAVGRGIDYLLDMRRPDGSWRRQLASATMQPPNQFYINRIYSDCNNLSVLACYYQEATAKQA